jgi:hypothetical protein
MIVLSRCLREGALAQGFIEVCGLSLDATPHPTGIYEQALRRVSHALVQARGSDYAKITTPRRYPRLPHLYGGRILLWTDINLRGRWLDLTNEDELPESVKSTIRIPENAKPNYRAFDYVFDDIKHNIWFESRSETGESLGAMTARRIFTRLLSIDVLGPEFPQIEVTIIPEEGAVERILDLPRLQTLFIRVVRPNPDASSPEARRRVLATLDTAHAQRMEVKLTKAGDAARLTAPEDIRELAQVAADIGFVRGEEKQLDGRKNVLSTEALPKRVQIEVDRAGTFIARVSSFLHL